MAAVPHTLLVPREAPIVHWLGLSVAAHVAMVGITLLVSALSAPRLIDLDQKPITASLVRLGKPRDEKLLPRKEEPPAPPKEAQGAESPVPIDKAIPVPIPGQQPTVKNTRKAAGDKAGEDRKSRLFGAFGKVGKSSEPLAGAADGDPLGDSDRSEGERYYALIQSQVRRLYDVSNTISEAERLRLVAELRVTIEKSGRVGQVTLSKSSGNDLFDAAVVAAVTKASPFSPPPDHLARDLRSGVVFRFRP